MARRVIYKLVSRLLFTKWHDKQDVAFLSSNVSSEEPSRAAQLRISKNRESRILHGKHGWCR